MAPKMAAAPAAELPRTRTLTIVAQDPAVRGKDGRILTACVTIPAEILAPGPRGYRVHVVDYEASAKTFYRPLRYPEDGSDPFMKVSDGRILNDPGFHCQNVYAIAMRTLARFEFALGRRVPWGFDGHQLSIAPHAFADANAFYSEADQALMFGYFPSSRKGNVFTCLSHDIVAHETTHAILDGIRTRFTDPSSPDQAAFHEAFADVVALLSVFSLVEIVAVVLDRNVGGKSTQRGRALIHESDITHEALCESVLLGLAEEMGRELQTARGDALRRSVKLEASSAWKKDPEYEEPHVRGEILVAAIMRSFIAVWVARLDQLGRVEGHFLDRGRVVEEGAEIADYLLTMCIRALDYTPPVHIEFSDFLSALLTADFEIRPSDTKYHFRDNLRTSFREYGISPSGPGGAEPGFWGPAPRLGPGRNRFESMTRDRDEMFRFVWDHRDALSLYAGGYSRVISVRPSLRVAPDDGFPLRETVAEVLHQLRVPASQLPRFGVEIPAGLDPLQDIEIQGGLTLIFDEYGQLKFAIPKPLIDRRDDHVQEVQAGRLRYLVEHGYVGRGAARRNSFSVLHRLRAMGQSRNPQEVW
jgi:hypothetical protein